VEVHIKRVLEWMVEDRVEVVQGNGSVDSISIDDSANLFIFK